VPVLVAVAIATAMFGYFAARVPVERDNDSMNARSDTRVQVYGSFRERFGNDEDLLLSVTRPGPIDASLLELLAGLTHEAEAIDGVARVYSLTNVRQLVTGRLGAEEAPLVAPPYATAVAELDATLDRNPYLEGLLVSRDRRTAALLIELEDRPGDFDFAARAIDALRALIAKHADRETSLHLTGIAVQKHDVAAYVGRDQAVLIPASVVVLALVLAAYFRRPVGVALPLAVTGISLVWTIGCYALCGLSLNTVTSLLPPVVMVLSLATSVHLIHGWLESADPSADSARHTADVVRSLRKPCLFTALTTAFGLSSLAVSDTPAIATFGIFASLGVMISLAIAMLVVPIGLTYVAPGRRHPVGHAVLSRMALAGARLATSSPRTVLAVGTLVTVAAACALPGLRSNTDLIRFLRPSAPLYRDTMFIDDHLGGVNALEFLVKRDDGDPLTRLEDVRRVRAFQQAAQSEAAVSGVYAITDALAQIQRAESGAPRPELPPTQSELSYAYDLLAQAPDRGLLARLITADLSEARITVRVRAIGSEQAAALVGRLQRLAADAFGDDYDVVATGSFYHVALDSNRIVAQQVESFALAFVLVIGAIGVSFRSWRVAVLSIAPNVFPIVWTGAFMALCGIELSTGTTMIASVVLGMAVDDTIHYLARYGREYHGDGKAAALATSASLGPALAATTIVLVLGFWVGAVGSFVPTVYFSVLTGVTMIAALLCDLIVLPAALVWSGTVVRNRRPAAATVAAAAASVVLLHSASVRAGDVAAPVASGQPEQQATVVGRAGPSATDRTLRTRFVPNSEERQGEVRLLARGGVAVVQTVLYSRVLKRVVGEILAKEARNWPVGGEGAADSARYTAALEDAAIAVWRRQMRSGRDDDRVQRLVIEFQRASDSCRVVIYELPQGWVASEAPVVGATPVADLDLSTVYVARNMELIAQDALGMSEREAREAIATIVSPGDDGGMPEPAATRPPPPADDTSRGGSR